MAQYMVKEANSQGFDAVLQFPEEVARNENYLAENSDRDLVVFMGPIGAVTTGKFKGYTGKVDAVLVAPQAAYLFNEAEKILTELDVPVEKMDSLAFGRMEAAKILTQGLELMKKNS
ncbi:PTS system, IIB subunit [Listeria floridensis FSL S10-1187]|uniref:PTS system, IIB subunit n=1 Tax=Listeria floridensis FSL S10-1187 TaxID=1265817 RepID=A0ABN0RCT5_9LIST|nr:PTS sugar transporter subunit IIB [Listeria floridensis]EUJ27456.1 PTS system, IIB subunit [Listeria floridensis FSL S10-1187]